MSWSAHKDPEQVKEHFDPEDVVLEKVKLLAKWVKNSKHFTAFTGAGVSTSAGIPDFRGPTGVWTLRAQGKEPTRSVSSLNAMPTVTHMSLVQLQNTGHLKYLISQNCDGLHRRSGMLPDKISELHGNSNLERCISCNKEYLRDFRAVASYKHSVHDHKTGRTCVACGGDLHDTIINFSETLPKVPLKRGFENAGLSDLMLVLGSSLTVSPANAMPEEVANGAGKKLVIVNLQKTHLDSEAALVINAKTDQVMSLLMTELGLEIPPFILRRRIKVDKKLNELELSGIDVDGTPATIIQGLQYKFNKKDAAVQTEKLKFVLDLKAYQTAFMKVFFFGNYNETPIDLEIPLGDKDFSVIYEMGYNPKTGDRKSVV